MRNPKGYLALGNQLFVFTAVLLLCGLTFIMLFNRREELRFEEACLPELEHQFVSAPSGDGSFRLFFYRQASEKKWIWEGHNFPSHLHSHAKRYRILLVVDSILKVGSKQVGEVETYIDEQGYSACRTP